MLCQAQLNTPVASAGAPVFCPGDAGGSRPGHSPHRLQQRSRAATSARQVIPEEFTGSKNSMKKFGLLLLGIVAMYFLTAFHVETAHGDFMPQHQ